jgi:hypothetical protein
MNQPSDSPDFGAGLSLDELVGMSAGEILSAILPNGDVFETICQAALVLYQRRLEACILVEIWADGHTFWHFSSPDEPVLVTPTGQLFRKGS